MQTRHLHFPHGHQAAKKTLFFFSKLVLSLWALEYANIPTCGFIAPFTTFCTSHKTHSCAVSYIFNLGKFCRRSCEIALIGSRTEQVDIRQYSNCAQSNEVCPGCASSCLCLRLWPVTCWHVPLSSLFVYFYAPYCPSRLKDQNGEILPSTIRTQSLKISTLNPNFLAHFEVKDK